MGESKSSKCDRIIPADKYEHNDEESEIWWRNLFKSLEDDIEVPMVHRREILEQVFPRTMVNKYCAIIGCNESPERQRPTDYDSIKSAEVDNSHKSDETVCPKRYKSHKVYETPYSPKTSTASIKVASDKSMKSDYDEEEEEEEGEGEGEEEAMGGSITSEIIQLLSTIDEEPIDEEVFRCENAGPNNPYKKFFKVPNERAAIWRPLPPLSFEQMNLTQKAEAITEAIATDFAKWLKSIGGDEKSSLDVNTIIKMFQIGFHTHAATSLCVRVKEMPSVPEEVANARSVKEASKRENLHRQLQRDIDICSKMKEMMFAFGKLLPPEMRIRAPSEDITTKWLTCSRIPEELEDMSAVWAGITNLRSTRGYCKWLMSHPDIPQPQFLAEMGMLSELKGRVASMEARLSYGMDYDG